MRYFVFLFLMSVSLWSSQGLAVYSAMSFKIHTLSPGQYDYSFVWNPLTEEATLRVGLLATKVDPFLENKEISFSTAQKVEFAAKDLPEISEGCQIVSRWHFEYHPGLSNHLMYMTLRGPTCSRAAQLFDILQIQVLFLGVPLMHFEPIDVAVDISR